MKTHNFAPLALALTLLAGCGEDRKQPAFPGLNPVKGVVRRGKAPASGGTVQFTPKDDKGEFMVTSVVGADGTFDLATVRATDTKAERKPGAPAGTYQVTYSPPAGDQTAGGAQGPIMLPAPVVVMVGPNDLTLDLPAPKK